MNVPNAADVLALVPELILIGMVLVLMLVARRIREGQTALVGTVAAALAAVFAAAWTPVWQTRTVFGEMLAVDGYGLFFKVLIGAILVVVALLSTIRREDDHAPRGEYHILLLLAATGMMLAGSAIDLIALYLSLELITICSFVLVGIQVDRPTSNEAAIKYFLVGSFASAVLLYGISLTYGLTGTTGYAGIANALAEPGAVSEPLLIVAISLVAAGLAFKIAAVPFHAWAPDAYQGASVPVAGFLAAGSKTAGLAALGRVLMVSFGTQARTVTIILVALAGLSIVVGSIVAVSQTDMKRLLAYSSITHAGYALLGLISGTPEGAAATMTYVFFYVFMTLGAFGVVVALGARGDKVEGFAGLAAQRPGTAALMLLFLLSLTGIPPTAGFAAKFVVITSAVRADQIVLAVIAVACSVITAFVYMRVAVLMYMKEPDAPAPGPMPLAVSAALVMAALVTFVFGLFPGALAPWVVAP